MIGLGLLLAVAVTVDKPDHLYSCNEEIVFTAKASAADSGKAYPWTIAGDGGLSLTGTWEVASGDLVRKVSLAKPGFVLMSVRTLAEKGKPFKFARAGAGVEPEKIRPGAEKPDDFDAYWADQIAKMRALPVKAVVREAPEYLDAKQTAEFGGKVKVYDVRLEDGVYNATGILTVPADATPGSCGALCTFGGASWTGAFTNPRAALDYHAMVFHMNLHDSKNKLTSEENREVRRRVKGYQYDNLDDREKYYPRKIFLRIVRSLDYVKSRPEWNRRELAARGPSMGGCQTIVAAALDKDVTVCAPGAPAMCDHTGYRADHICGYPDVLSHYRGDPEKFAKAERNSAYFDVVNFARNVKCEVCFGVGFVDVTCPPTSVYAAFNSMPSERKTIHNAVLSGHDDGAFKGDRQGRIRDHLKAK